MTAQHVFISYVREDSQNVDQLQRTLEGAGIAVWRDTADLWPGDDWRAKIRSAITENALVFIACFSRRGLGRGRSYQNEELLLAVDQVRLRLPDVPWLIPVRLDDCVIPNLDLGGGRTLASIQRVDLFGDRRAEDTERLVAVILRILNHNSSVATYSKAQARPKPTWTGTRLETIQDQIRYLLAYGDVSDGDIEQVAHAVSEKAVQEVGLYAWDDSELRIIEVDLRIDWLLGAALTLRAPNISGGLSGWDEKQAPEVKVAGRRFANTAMDLGLSTNWRVSLAQKVKNDPILYSKWKQELTLGRSAPGWKSPPVESNEALLDLGEASIYLRRSGN